MHTARNQHKCGVAHTIDSPTRHLVEITYTSPTMTQPLIKYGDPLRIVDQLDETGVVCLENAVPTEWLADVRTEVQDWLLNHGVRDHLIHLPQGEGQSAADAFVNNRAVLSLLSEIARTRFPDADPELIVSALRVAAEPRSENDAFGFHYDASVVTMIVPIFSQMPSLVMRANSWPYLTSGLSGALFFPTSLIKPLDKAGSIAVTSCAGSTALAICKRSTWNSETFICSGAIEAYMATCHANQALCEPPSSCISAAPTCRAKH